MPKYFGARKHEDFQIKEDRKVIGTLRICVSFAPARATAGGPHPFAFETLRVYTDSFAQVPNMFAIIQARGRQVKVTPGGFATIEGTAGEPGAEVTLDRVLLVEKDGGDVVAGAPFVANARVLAVVAGETRGPKIRVFKKKRRKGMRRTKGHRAVYTRVRITDITL